jgi:hypothetical protein
MAEEGRGEPRTFSTEPWITLLHNQLLFVKWEFKDCGLSMLQGSGRTGPKWEMNATRQGCSANSRVVKQGEPIALLW